MRSQPTTQEHTDNKISHDKIFVTCISNEQHETQSKRNLKHEKSFQKVEAITQYCGIAEIKSINTLW